MSTFSELRKESYRWATKNYDADADDEAEKSYRLHIRERDELLVKQATCKRKLRSSSRKKCWIPVTLGVYGIFVI